MPDAALENQQAGIRVQQQFEFYLLALTFTLLGFAVQTARFDPVILPTVAELSGWAALLLSGLFGMSRLEWQPSQFALFARKLHAENQVTMARKAALSGAHIARVLSNDEDVPLADLAESGAASAAQISTQIEKLQRKAKYKYNVQRALFVLGLIALMLSRAWPGLVALQNR
jgi:hypothetical protein